MTQQAKYSGRWECYSNVRCGLSVSFLSPNRVSFTAHVVCIFQTISSKSSECGLVGVYYTFLDQHIINGIRTFWGNHTLWNPSEYTLVREADEAEDEDSSGHLPHLVYGCRTLYCRLCVKPPVFLKLWFVTWSSINLWRLQKHCGRMLNDCIVLFEDYGESLFHIM